MARGLSELYPEEKPVEKLKDPRENPRMRFLNNEFKE